jgi:hypothetical protein
LGRLLCFRGELELDSADIAGARATLAEVERLAVDLGWGPESELGSVIGSLRDTVAARTRQEPTQAP